jgi:8-oxo-dGTP pyrophosphatase MutT (NUDIX family)
MGEASARIDAMRLRAALAGRGESPRGHDAFGRPGAKDAAVVLPLRLTDDPSVIAVLRASHLAEHAGEVAFPGGKPEPGDQDLAATALREMEEEIGVSASDVERLGELSPIYVLSGRYLIHPYVAVMREDAQPEAQPGEVARLLEIPILPFIKGERPTRGVAVDWNGASFVSPHFEVDDYILYGASAFIFHELLRAVAAVLGVPLPGFVMQEERPWKHLVP